MGAQAVILRNNSHVLLVRHTYRPGWHFPGGGVEKNETPATAVIREMQEEAGVIPQYSPELFGLYANFEAFPSDHIALYVVRDWTQPKVPKPNAEIAEQGFFAIDELPDGATPAVARRLDEIIRNRAPSDQW